MKINTLLEYTSPSSQPNQSGGQAPKFGRDPNVLETTAGATGSGSVGGEATAMPGMQTRGGKGSMLKGIKTSKKFVNSPMTEDEISEEQLLAKQLRKELFKRSKDKELGDRPSDRDIISKEEFDGGGEYNDEVDMVQNNLHTIVRVSTHLGKELQANENLPEWVQEKIAVCKSMIVTVMDYMISQHERGNIYTVDESEKIHIPHFISKSTNDFKGVSRGKDTDKINVPSIARKTSTGNMSSVPKFTSPDNGEIDIDSILRDKGLEEADKNLPDWMKDTIAMANKMFPNAQGRGEKKVQQVEKPKHVPQQQQPKKSDEEHMADIHKQIAKYYSDNDDTHRYIGDSVVPKRKMAEGMGGQVVFSGTGDNGGKYEIIQSGDDFMIHANGKHIDSYGSLQRAMSVLKNEVPGLKKTVGENNQPNTKSKEDYLNKREHLQRQLNAPGLSKQDRDYIRQLIAKLDSVFKNQNIEEDDTGPYTVWSGGLRIAGQGAAEKARQLDLTGELDDVDEGAKVDRMIKHIKSSEKKLGHSDKEAENIAWATANKRGMLNNKNKKVEENIDETDNVRVATQMLQHLLKTNRNLLSQYGDTVIGDAIVSVAEWYRKNNKPLDIEKMSNTVAKLINKSFNTDISEAERPGLWANIHAKRERIKHGSGERMRKPGSKGAPIADAFRKSAK